MCTLHPDSWVEHEEAYNARGKGLSSGLLVILVANRQGAENFMSQVLQVRMAELQQAAQLESSLMDYCQPAPEGFLQGGLPGHLPARHTPCFRLPKTFLSGRT